MRGFGEVSCNKQAHCKLGRPSQGVRNARIEIDVFLQVFICFRHGASPFSVAVCEACSCGVWPLSPRRPFRLRHRSTPSAGFPRNSGICFRTIPPYRAARQECRRQAHTSLGRERDSHSRNGGPPFPAPPELRIAYRSRSHQGYRAKRSLHFRGPRYRLPLTHEISWAGEGRQPAVRPRDQSGPVRRITWIESPVRKFRRRLRNGVFSILAPAMSVKGNRLYDAAEVDAFLGTARRRSLGGVLQSIAIEEVGPVTQHLPPPAI